MVLFKALQYYTAQNTSEMCTRACSYYVVRELKVFSRSQIPCVLNANVARRLYHAQIRTVGLGESHMLRGELCCGTFVPKVAFCTERSRGKLKLSNEPNQFGNLSKDSPVEKLRDEGDRVEDSYITYPVSRGQQLRIKQYADIIKQHLQKKEIEAAVNVLEIKMITEDRVKPDAYIYSLIISACGRFGHTKKAFKLYNQMKKRGLKVPGAVYTALFNACANAACPKDGLERTLKLQNLLTEKGVELNVTHYHAMMKAFGRCGDLSRTFEVVDIMIDKQMQLKEETFNFLLHACISNKEDGFRYALLVWHKMVQKKVEPSFYTFNLLLRSVRDCCMGEFQDVEKLTQLLSLEKEPETSAYINANVYNNQLNDVADHQESLMLQQENFKSSWEYLPDLLSSKPILSYDISSLDLRKPHERLFLLGGCNKFLDRMEKCCVAPNIKTYTLMLDCIPPTISAEKRLMSRMRKDGICIDIEFCNMLIKKRSFRFDYQNAQDVLRLIHMEKLEPDIITFGVLALACTNEDEAKQLIRNMRQAGYRMNEEILGAMLKQGCIQHNFKYVMKILYLTKLENVKPSPLFTENINSLIASSREILKSEFKGDVPSSLKNRPFRKEFTTFMYKYEAWLKEVNETENKVNSKYK